jgi:hypothetical protein
MHGGNRSTRYCARVRCCRPKNVSDRWKAKNHCACYFLFEIVFSQFIGSRLDRSFLLEGAIRENLPTAITDF